MAHAEEFMAHAGKFRPISEEKLLGQVEGKICAILFY